MLKTKSHWRMEIKEISAEGTFEGRLSPYGNVDQGGDVVEYGAYDKTLADKGNTRPLLWQHKSDSPIGQLALESRADGLWCKGQLLMVLAEAQKAYVLIKAGIVRGLSIGFEAIKDSVEGGVRHLKEIKLYEGSIVTFPMNEMALIMSVKGFETKGDFNEELAAEQLQDAGRQMFCALQNALSSVLWSDLAPDEKNTASETIIQQFNDAYLNFQSAFLSMIALMSGGMEMYNAKRMERKFGAAFSAANKQSLSAACNMIDDGHAMVKSGNDSIRALFADEAGKATTSIEAGAVTTLESKAAPKSEPVIDHSAAQILELRSLIPTA